MLICQLTDLHVRPVGQPANRVVETNMFTERAFRAVARLSPRPDVVLLTGDLTDGGLDAEYANVKRLLRILEPLPVFVIPGNHDRRDRMRAALSHLPGVTSDPEFVQFVLDDYPVRIVMLDTLVPGQTHGELGPARLDFLARTLAAAPDKSTLVAMHHPPFACGMPHMDRIALRDSAAFAAVIGRHPQVGRIICGHHHRPVVAQVAHAVATIAPSVAHQVTMSLEPAPGAFVFEPPAFGLHLWDAATGFVSHTVYVEDYPGPYPFIAEPDASPQT
ncbi:MAG TPA: phosphodiesterase [Acetobacteraceae bacterium]|nr:phosphodiesterase [Acetobacteraceae bacterium]